MSKDKKMRVYEIAKENNVSSKEVLAVLEKKGIKLASHMSVVSDEGLAHLKDFFKKDKTKKVTSVDKKIKANQPVKKNAKPVAKPKKDLMPTKAVESKKIVIQKAVEPKVLPANTPAKTAQTPAKKTFSRPSRPSYVKPPEAQGQQRFFKPRPSAKEEVTEITIKEAMPLFQAADLMGKSSGDLIIALLKKGMACNRNYLLPADVISMLAGLFGIEVTFSSAAKVKDTQGDLALRRATSGNTRWPVVVVMGHVDHGKTTLLDFIRKMNTVSREKGGITQHLAAYEVDSQHGKIVFLDTPGHEAFSFIRSRGTSVTDIAVLVIAADDGIKPQTVEAIEYARKAKVPIIVAINKIDKIQSDAAIQTVKRQLAEKDLVPEDWGGDVICVPISAKTGKGVDELLEMIVLQAEMMDLKADSQKSAKAFVLESKTEKGYGPVATIISLEGTVKKGDYFICGNGTGKVRLLVNSYGEKIAQAGPSVPVKVVGFDQAIESGDWLNVVSQQEYLKAKSSRRGHIDSGVAQQAQSLEGMMEKGLSKQRFLNLIIKTDTRGSKEAIEGSIAKLSRKKKKGFPLIKIISSGVGDISEGDVELAITTKSCVLGLHIKAEKNAELLSKDKKVKLKLFQIIYKFIEYIEETLEKQKEIEIVWTKVAELYVKKVFNIKKVGVIAGCDVKEGVVSRNNTVVCIRDGVKVGEGKITSLQRETKTVKEVHAGYECGFICDGFNDWQIGDVVEVLVKTKKTEE